jgi:hypothetical protein
VTCLVSLYRLKMNKQEAVILKNDGHGSRSIKLEYLL